MRQMRGLCVAALLIVAVVGPARAIPILYIHEGIATEFAGTFTIDLMTGELVEDTISFGESFDTTLETCVFYDQVDVIDDGDSISFNALGEVRTIRALGGGFDEFVDVPSFLSAFDVSFNLAELDQVFMGPSVELEHFELAVGLNFDDMDMDSGQGAAFVFDGFLSNEGMILTNMGVGAVAAFTFTEMDGLLTAVGSGYLFSGELVSFVEKPIPEPPIPEPATLGLFGLGLAGMALRRRWARKA